MTCKQEEALEEAAVLFGDQERKGNAAHNGQADFKISKEKQDQFQDQKLCKEAREGLEALKSIMLTT